MNKKIVYIIILCFMYSNSFSQKMQWNNEFSEHLINNKLFDDFLTYLELPFINPPSVDSINFLKATVYYKQELNDSALMYFKMLPVDCPLISTSKLYEYDIFLQKKDYLNALSTIQSLQKKYPDFYSINKNGLLLLSRDYSGVNFNNSIQDSYFKKKDLAISEYYYQLQNVKKKSRCVAGVLSAVMPGLGKIYSGKYHQGVSSFMTLAGLALMTYEGYQQHSFSRYLFGGMFIAFYFGNIFGSMLSVNISYYEKTTEIDNHICNTLQLTIRHILQ